MLGVILGILVPLLVTAAIYKMRFGAVPWNDFKQDYLSSNRIITFFGVWCLVANTAVFTYYINTHKDRTAKAIFAVTLLYALSILAIKLFR